MQIKTFYSYFRSSTAYRLRIALNLKGITPDRTIYINLRDGEQQNAEYRAVNPMAAVPALELKDGNILTQSLALLEWLEEHHPSPALLPKDSLQRAQIRAFTQIIGCDIHPVNNLRILNYLSTHLAVNETTKKQWIHHWIHAAFHALEAQVVSAGGKTFCFGDTPSMADVCLVPQWYNAERFAVDLTPYPALAQRVAHCRNLPAFIAAAPENQPDAI